VPGVPSGGRHAARARMLAGSTIWLKALGLHERLRIDGRAFTVTTESDLAHSRPGAD